MPAARFLDAPADLALDLRRGHRKALVRPAHRDAKGARIVADRDRAGSRAAIASMSSGARPARAKLPAPNTFVSRSRTPAQSAPSPARPRHAPEARAPAARRDPAVASRMLRTSRDTNHGPVPALERDFLIVDDDGLHCVVRDAELAEDSNSNFRFTKFTIMISAFSIQNSALPGRPVAAHDGALDRAREARVDPVAGEPEARESGRRSAGRAGCPAASENVACFSRTTVARTSARRARREAPPRPRAPRARSARRRARRTIASAPLATSDKCEASRPNASRLSKTHCIERPGRPTNGSSMTAGRTRG